MLPRATAQYAEALEIGRRAGAVPEQLRALAGLAAIAAAEGDRELAEEGLAMVCADPAAYSEIRRFVRTATERYGLTVGEPIHDRLEVLERLEAVAAGRVTTG
jgi:hypothetical protein